jgi:hypothetical protein
MKVTVLYAFKIKDVMVMPIEVLIYCFTLKLATSTGSVSFRFICALSSKFVKYGLKIAKTHVKNVCHLKQHVFLWEPHLISR